MALTTLSGDEIILFYGDTDDINEAKIIVCETDSSYEGTRSSSSEETKCGVLKARGNQDNRISGNAVTNITPGPNEGSFMDLLELFTNDTKQYFWYKDAGENINISGQGWFSSIGTQNKSADHSRFTWTLEIEGNISTVATS